MNILYVSNDFPTDSDSSRYLYIWDSIKSVTDCGVSTHILHSRPWKPGKKNIIHYNQFTLPIDHCLYLSIPRHYFRSISNLSYIYTVQKHLIRISNNFKPDVIHAHGEICGLAALSVGKKLGIPVALTIHGIDTCSRVWRGYNAKMFTQVLNNVDSLIFVGEPLQKAYEDKAQRKNHQHILHNGVRIPDATARKEYNKEIQIISVSNLVEGKGVDLNLQALGKLKKQGIQNWRYTIIGSGDQIKYLKKIIAENNLEDNVIFMGECTHQQVYGQLSKADIFCLPSYREAFGIAYLEAMAHGLLTIGVEGQGPSAFIAHEKTGFLVRPNDINHLAEVLELSILNYQNIAQTGRNYVLNHFTWKHHAEKLISIYQDMIS